MIYLYSEVPNKYQYPSSQNIFHVRSYDYDIIRPIYVLYKEVATNPRSIDYIRFNV